MKNKLTLTWALAVLFALVFARSAAAQKASEPTRKAVASASHQPKQPDRQALRSVLISEAAQEIDEIQAGSGGSVFLVDCQGTFGYDTIQGAIDDAENGDVVVVLPRNAFGFECDGDAYVENINLLGKAVTVQSLIPTNPDYVEATVIDGSGASEEEEEGSVVTFNHEEGEDSVLDGLTLTRGIGFEVDGVTRSGGGIYCGSSSPTIRNCTVSGNMVPFNHDEGEESTPDRLGLT